MTSAATPRPNRSDAPARRRGALAPTLVVLAVIVVLVLLAAQIWTEVLWFDQLGFLEVFTTQWFTRAALFVVGALVMGGAVWLSIRVAYRNRPVYPPTSREQAVLDHYREQFEPLRRLVTIAAPLVLGFFAGMAASQQWEAVQLWINRVPFGEVDPEFGMDLSFFVFTLPLLRSAVSFVMAVVVISGIAALALHYLYGGIQLGQRERRVTAAARVQLAVLGTILMLLVATNYYLDRFSLLTASGSLIDGAAYTDVNAVMPSKLILAVVAVIVALLFVVTAVRGNWRLPLIGVGLMVVSAIVIGGIYPAIVQRFQVSPNEQELEAEYIQRNIDATKKAYGLDEVEVIPYPATTEATQVALRDDAQTTASIRLLDPALISPSFRQLQQNKQYYDFPNTLSVDRYEVNGSLRDTVIAVRELNLSGLGADQRSWVNDHTVYTHGFGVVAAYGNTTGADGRPAFYEGGIPSVGLLGDYEPRIYFSPNSPSYSIVGAPAGTTPWELDYPDDAAGGQVNTTYTGDGGPDIGGLWRKVLYALKFGSEQILFSERVTDESQILYDRDPQERVSKVAPYLTLDGRVYPAVVDERVVWVVDAYTTTDAYPYSSLQSLEDATTDSLNVNTAQALADLLPAQVNYIRNSVKATVDAYDGSVTLYAWDTEDPMLQAWSKVFPTTITSMEEISGDLMSHLRYPEDLFKVQRTLLSTYHVDDASDYYSGQDFWRNPPDPAASEVVAQPPYYLTLQMPEQDEPTFSLTSTFIPGGNSNRNVLTGFLAVDAEPGNEAGSPREEYGTLRLLELPRNSTVPGPGQVQNTFNSENRVQSELNVLRLGNSTVISGNLLTLPVGGGLLYVQPVYVQSSQGTQFPLLRKVLVAFGEEVGFGDDLDEALDMLFGEGLGEDLTGDQPDTDIVPDAPLDPDDGGDGTTSPTETVEPTETATPVVPGDGGTPRERLDAALARASQAWQDSQAALSDGDFAAYGEAQDALAQAIEDAMAAEAELDAG